MSTNTQQQSNGILHKLGGNSTAHQLMTFIELYSAKAMAMAMVNGIWFVVFFGLANFSHFIRYLNFPHSYAHIFGSYSPNHVKNYKFSLAKKSIS